MTQVYLAGPLFDDGERWWMEQLELAVREVGLAAWLPHRDNPPKTRDNTAEIFRNNVEAIDACRVVVASLNGVTTDDGTAWEIGYAHATGKPILGLHTDWRKRFETEVVNLMIEESVDRMLSSVGELMQVLQSDFGAS